MFYHDIFELLAIVQNNYRNDYLITHNMPIVDYMDSEVHDNSQN